MPLLPSFYHVSDCSSFVLIQDLRRCFCDHSRGCKTSSAPQAGNVIGHQHCPFLQRSGNYSEGGGANTRGGVHGDTGELRVPHFGYLHTNQIETICCSDAASQWGGGGVSYATGEGAWLTVRQTARAQKHRASPPPAALLHLPPRGCV